MGIHTASSSRRHRRLPTVARLCFWALSASCLSASIAAAQDTSAEPIPQSTWQEVESPESVGFSSEKLEEAEALFNSLPSTALMVIADGRVLANWGKTDAKYPIHSIRKSILGVLYGRQVESGAIALDSTLAELGIDDQEPPLTDEEKTATVADLLTARSGVYHPASYETRGRAAQRPEPGSHTPGTFWYYNNWDFNVLGTVYERAAGRSVHEAFTVELAQPLGMQDWNTKDGRNVKTAASIHTAYTFNLSTRDLARFGLLVLREGRWGGRQIVPEDWLRESTRAHTEAEYTLGWGYLWWVAEHGYPYPGFEAKGPVFMARGTGGHLVLCLPHLDLVIVHRVNSTMPNPANYVSSQDLGALLQRIVDARSP